MSIDLSTSSGVQSARPAAEARELASPEKALQAPPKVKLALPEKPAPQLNTKEQEQNLREAIDRLNEQMKSKGRDLSFSVDSTTDRTVIQVKSSETGKVIRQIPNETLLQVAHNIEQVKGILLNETT